MKSFDHDSFFRHFFLAILIVISFVVVLALFERSVEIQAKKTNVYSLFLYGAKFHTLLLLEKILML